MYKSYVLPLFNANTAGSGEVALADGDEERNQSRSLFAAGVLAVWRDATGVSLDDDESPESVGN